MPCKISKLAETIPYFYEVKRIPVWSFDAATNSDAAIFFTSTFGVREIELKEQCK